MFCVDGTAKTMCSPAWQLLLTRIGDTLMLYLLLHVSMFSTLENDCFFQLTGYPVTLAARAVKKTSQVQQGRLSMKRYYETFSFNSASKITSRNRKRTKVQDDTAEKTNAEGGTAVQEGPKAAKPGRPSSWQRKKYKRAKQRGDEETLRELESQRDEMHRKKPVSQEVNTASSMHTKRRARKSDRKKEHYQHPKYLLRPSEMIIPRQSMFYSRRYSRKGGLPLERRFQFFFHATLHGLI